MSSDNAAKAFEELQEFLNEIKNEHPSSEGRSQKGLETKSAILAAARTIFVEEGHAGLSLGKVATACGVRKGNIAYYYKTKAELLEALLYVEYANFFGAHIELFDADSQSALDILMNVVDFYLIDSGTNYRFYLQKWGFVASDPIAQELVSKIYDKVVRSISMLLVAARPENTKEQAHTKALEILVVIEGLNVLHGLTLNETQAMRTVEKESRRQIERIVRDE